MAVDVLLNVDDVVGDVMGCIDILVTLIDRTAVIDDTVC